MIHKTKLQEKISELESFVIKEHPKITEGSASLAELFSLISYADSVNATSIVEIGFNAGLSSCAFLANNPDTQVTSFDIGEHGYVKTAKEFIDKEFPGRHRLIIGNSLESVPHFASEVGGQHDLLFIDGGHTYSEAKADIFNMRALAKPNAIVIMDDLTPWLPWGFGPYFAWRHWIKRGLVNEIARHRDGDWMNRRTWAAGKYIPLNSQD